MTHPRHLACLTLTGCLAFLVPVAGCVVSGTVAGCGVLYQPANSKATKSAAVTHVAAAPVDVMTENGAITITKSEGAEVTITANIRATTQERADAVTVTSERSPDGTLVVRVNWPGGKRLGSEGAAIDISMPEAGGVTLRTSNGAITMSGMTGAANLHSSNGAIKVHGHSGHVDADTSNGKIELLDVRSAKADTSNGAVNVRLLADSAGPVDIDTSNGGVTLEVGTAFDATLTAKTSNGKASCTAAGATVVSSGRGSGVFKFGTGEKTGTIHSSNGGITIKSRG